MDEPETLGSVLKRRGFSRRSLLKFAIAMTSSLALPPSIAPLMAANLARAKRRSVIWLSFQECTGCLETLLRSSSPTIDSLIFDFISLDYQESLMAAAGTAAVRTLREAVAANKGEYLLAIDGSIPTKDGGVYSLTGGRSNFDMLMEFAADAKAVLAIGTCAAYGGIPKAHPNPTGAVGVEDLVTNKPIVNIPGCPPVPEVLSGVLVHFVSFGKLPELDDRKRPLAYFGTTIHDQCYRRPFYDQGKFAKSFDDEGARQGWCLFELGCKGPVTHNACASLKWNSGTSFPIESGHGCIGCSEPDFWDKGSFYTSLAGGSVAGWRNAGIAAAVGIAGGAAAALTARRKPHAEKAERDPDKPKPKTADAGSAGDVPAKPKDADASSVDAAQANPKDADAVNADAAPAKPKDADADNADAAPAKPQDHDAGNDAAPATPKDANASSADATPAKPKVAGAGNVDAAPPNRDKQP